MEDRIGDAVAGEFTRGDLIRRAAVAGLGLTVLFPKHAGARIVREPASAIGRRALNEAIKNLGTKENPPGSNRTPYGKWYGFDGVPWSNIFVSYCFAVGANYVLGSGFDGPGVHSKGFAYIPATEAWLRDARMWKGRTTPKPGDIAIYSFGGQPVHIGIVEAYLGGGVFSAIEGNTNDNGGAISDGVYRRRRSVTDGTGFGRVVE